MALYRGDTCLVPLVWRADTWLTRLRGLLLRPPLAVDTGLLLAPCASVHTCGMGYPLDLLFLGRDNEVLGWREHLAPWRRCGQRGARATLELRGGSLRQWAPIRGEVLQWRSAEPC